MRRRHILIPEGTRGRGEFAFLVASESLKNTLTTSSRHDPVIGEQRPILQYGWPDNANQLSEHSRPFFTFRDELVIEKDLLFKGNRLYVPAGEQIRYSSENTL